MYIIFFEKFILSDERVLKKQVIIGLIPYNLNINDNKVIIIAKNKDKEK
jgi:hypothetical protein